MQGGGGGGDQGPRPRVCRRLFTDEPMDAGVQDNMLNQINEQISRDLDDACRKYNFDFRNELPLEGNWQWERLPGQPPKRRENPPAEAPEEEPPSSDLSEEPPQDPPAQEPRP